jgi:hypothetical protein
MKDLLELIEKIKILKLKYNIYMHKKYLHHT